MNRVILSPLPGRRESFTAFTHRYQQAKLMTDKCQGHSGRDEDASLWTQTVLALNLGSSAFSCGVSGRLVKLLTLSFLTYKKGGRYSS